MTAGNLENRPCLTRDDAPAKKLASVPLTADWIRAIGRGSIKPHLYAVDPERAKAAVSADVKSFLSQLCRLWQRFIEPEYVGGENLELLMAKPRAGRQPAIWGADATPAG